MEILHLLLLQPVLITTIKIAASRSIKSLKSIGIAARLAITYPFVCNYLSICVQLTSTHFGTVSFFYLDTCIACHSLGKFKVSHECASFDGGEHLHIICCAEKKFPFPHANVLLSFAAVTTPVLQACSTINQSPFVTAILRNKGLG